MNYQTATLPCGLRVILMPSQSPVIYCGYAVHAGTRHERPGEEGLAHFCEHLSFKGTTRRSAVQILNAIEGVGGELNAFTGKEDTVYYAAVTRPHLARAVDVLTDIVFHSQYPQPEVEKECQVVCDEIESYEDSPAELIFDEFENILFQNHPLGHNILGTASQVRRYNGSDARRFTQRHYQPTNAVFFVSGDVDFARLTRRLQAVLSPSASASEAIPPEASVPATTTTATQTAPIVRQRSTHQAHVMVGTTAYAASDHRRWALYLLNNLLGGPSLNSRLNLVLRERNALVYTVESQMVCYSDTGLWSVYFGCDPSDVQRCLQLVEKELKRLCERPLSAAQLKRAKQQLHGQLAIAADNREQYTLDAAKHFLHEGQGHDLAKVLARVDELTSDELLSTARELFSKERLITLIYK